MMSSPCPLFRFRPVAAVLSCSLLVAAATAQAQPVPRVRAATGSAGTDERIG